MTASKSRKKHHQEIVFKALQVDQINRKKARESFCFTNLNYLQHASYEPLMHQPKEEPEEGIELDGSYNLVIYIQITLIFKEMRIKWRPVQAVTFSKVNQCFQPQ